MPVRSEKKQQSKEIAYSELLKMISSYITETYGSTVAFVNSEDFLKCGFLNTEIERRKIRNYLALPKEGEMKKVQSVPALSKIAEGLMNLSVKGKVNVVRTTKIYVTTLG